MKDTVMASNEVLSRDFVTRLKKYTREKNREVIDPLIPELTLDAFEELVDLTAKVRGAYLKQFFYIAEHTEGDFPKGEELKKLQGMREVYEEMIAAHQALETAVERGYLTVKQG
ncbi:hypothetical protein V5T82_13775 [Magnetovibrio sp. PR-2]|uniref:hypothetical protein n=1 Tax=Magnetovibrio sp. PR-2 TaxID=3120356 RepID=UPI002FCDF6B8